MHHLTGKYILITDPHHPFYRQPGLITDADDISIVVKIIGALTIHVVVRDGQYEIMEGEEV
jgi:hypothetical protein